MLYRRGSGVTQSMFDPWHVEALLRCGYSSVLPFSVFRVSGVFNVLVIFITSGAATAQSCSAS